MSLMVSSLDFNSPLLICESFLAFESTYQNQIHVRDLQYCGTMLFNVNMKNSQSTIKFRTVDEIDPYYPKRKGNAAGKNAVRDCRGVLDNFPIYSIGIPPPNDEELARHAAVGQRKRRSG
ncbi:hypothetical protein RCL1_004436 [Eukaryota sp. TZLM3-RCL]